MCVLESVSNWKTACSTGLSIWEQPVTAALLNQKSPFEPSVYYYLVEPFFTGFNTRWIAFDDHLLEGQSARYSHLSAQDLAEWVSKEIATTMNRSTENRVLWTTETELTDLFVAYSLKTETGRLALETKLEQQTIHNIAVVYPGTNGLQQGAKIRPSVVYTNANRYLDDKQLIEAVKDLITRDLDQHRNWFPHGFTGEMVPWAEKTLIH